MVDEWGNVRFPCSASFCVEFFRYPQYMVAVETTLAIPLKNFSLSPEPVKQGSNIWEENKSNFSDVSKKVMV
jgi:hypothetical protein